jgi:rare lipoprotein A (peptidoglycan hydrolase)
MACRFSLEIVGAVLADRMSERYDRGYFRRTLSALLLAAALVSVFGAAACGGESEEQAQEETPQEEQTAGGEANEELQQKQRAAYYGEEVAGNPTASGELYDPSGFTAAHKELPFGTVLEVCYHDCNEVTVNDRNPDSEADLDLSLAAADYIGLTTDGRGVVDTQLVE